MKQIILEKLKLIKTDFEFSSLNELELILNKYKIPEQDNLQEDIFGSNELKSIIHDFENKLERTNVENHYENNKENNKENQYDNHQKYESNEFNKYLKEEEERDEVSNKAFLSKPLKNSNKPQYRSDRPDRQDRQDRYDRQDREGAYNQDNSNFGNSLKSEVGIKGCFNVFASQVIREFDIESFQKVNPIRSVNNRIGDYNDHEENHIRDYSQGHQNNNNQNNTNNTLDKHIKKFKNTNKQLENNLNNDNNEENNYDDIATFERQEQPDVEIVSANESFDTKYNLHQHYTKNHNNIHTNINSINNNLDNINGFKSSKKLLHKDDSSKTYHNSNGRSSRSLLKKNHSLTKVNTNSKSKIAKVDEYFNRNKSQNQKITVLYERTEAEDNLYVGKDLIDKLFNQHENKIVQFSYNELNKISALLLDYLKTEKERNHFEGENEALKNE